MSKEVVVLGAGLAGLSAAYSLAQRGIRSVVFEKENKVGGLSKTIKSNAWRFDLGGHRFFTESESLNNFVRALLKDKMETVLRQSKIYYDQKYYNYPLEVSSILSTFGLVNSYQVFTDFLLAKLKIVAKRSEQNTLEAWIISNFGNKLYSMFFKDYNEKIWGLPCSELSKDWAKQRIKGLTLLTAIKNAILKNNKHNRPVTLCDTFLYPTFGIGRISDMLEEYISSTGKIFVNSQVVSLRHENGMIRSVTIDKDNRKDVIAGTDFVSSIPLPALIKYLVPSPPSRIQAAANSLLHRDLIVVFLQIDKRQLSKEHWVYFPSKDIPFIRMHEPRNWSLSMAPPGKTSLVIEYICSRDDSLWHAQDKDLCDISIQSLKNNLGYLQESEILGAEVVRYPCAYPIYRLGYSKQLFIINNYLKQFKNLQTIGRSGRFKYCNMDEAILNGMSVTAKIIR